MYLAACAYRNGAVSKGFQTLVQLQFFETLLKVKAQLFNRFHLVRQLQRRHHCAVTNSFGPKESTTIKRILSHRGNAAPVVDLPYIHHIEGIRTDPGNSLAEGKCIIRIIKVQIPGRIVHRREIRHCAFAIDGQRIFICLGIVNHPPGQFIAFGGQEGSAANFPLRAQRHQGDGFLGNRCLLRNSRLFFQLPRLAGILVNMGLAAANQLPGTVAKLAVRMIFRKCAGQRIRRFGFFRPEAAFIVDMLSDFQIAADHSLAAAVVLITGRIIVNMQRNNLPRADQPGLRCLRCTALFRLADQHSPRFIAGIPMDMSRFLRHFAYKHGFVAAVCVGMAFVFSQVTEQIGLIAGVRVEVTFLFLLQTEQFPTFLGIARLFVRMDSFRFFRIRCLITSLCVDMLTDFRQTAQQRAFPIPAAVIVIMDQEICLTTHKFTLAVVTCSVMDMHAQGFIGAAGHTYGNR